MSFHLYFWPILFRFWPPPMTLLIAGVLTDPQLPAISSNVCTTDARLGGVGQVAPLPNKNPGYTGGHIYITRQQTRHVIVQTKQ